MNAAQVTLAATLRGWRPMVCLECKAVVQPVVSGPAAARALREYLSRHESPVLRYLLELWESERGLVTAKTLADAMASGQIPQGWVTAFEADYSRFVTESLVPRWAVATGAGSLLERGISGWTWKNGAKWFSEYVARNSGELITNLAVQQMEAIRAALYHFTVEEVVTSTKLAQILRPMVGLTTRQMRAALNLRARLEKLGLRPDVINRRVYRYTRRANRLRAEMIARTELSTAWNTAQIRSFRDAVQDGAIIGAPYKQWETSDDELVCPTCGPLDEENVPLDQAFKSGHDHPPAHPNCRCVLIYGTAE